MAMLPALVARVKIQALPISHLQVLPPPPPAPAMSLSSLLFSFFSFLSPAFCLSSCKAPLSIPESQVRMCVLWVPGEGTQGWWGQTDLPSKPGSATSGHVTLGISPRLSFPACNTEKTYLERMRRDHYTKYLVSVQ